MSPAGRRFLWCRNYINSNNGDSTPFGDDFGFFMSNGVSRGERTFVWLLLAMVTDLTLRLSHSGGVAIVSASCRPSLIFCSFSFVDLPTSLVSY